MFKNKILLRYALAVAVITACTIVWSPACEANVNTVSNSVVAQDKELLIQVQGLTVKNYSAVRKSIEDNDGVVFKDYCFGTNVLMYIIDRDLQRDNQFVDAALSPFGLTYVVKEGTILQVQENCPDNNDGNNQSTE
jgi:hypothetical protein